MYILVVRFSWTHMMHLHTKKRMIDVSQKVCYKHSKTGLCLFSIKISGEEMAWKQKSIIILNRNYRGFILSLLFIILKRSANVHVILLIKNQKTFKCRTELYLWISCRVNVDPYLLQQPCPAGPCDHNRPSSTGHSFHRPSHCRKDLGRTYLCQNGLCDSGNVACLRLCNYKPITT